MSHVHGAGGRGQAQWGSMFHVQRGVGARLRRVPRDLSQQFWTSNLNPSLSCFSVMG